MTTEEEKRAAVEQQIKQETDTDPDSPFRDNGFRVEASEVVKGIDLSGKTFLVTGASSGLGRATTHALLLAGAHVILAVRRPEAGEQAAAELRDKAGNGSTDVLQLDLSSLKSVRSAAKAILARNKPLHAVICNAGVMASPLRRTVNGFESQFATNHLGHALLVCKLTPALVAAGGGARVVVVASSAHKRNGIQWDDINFTESYDKWTAYAQSKTANMLFAAEYNRRMAGKGVEAFCLHPGGIMTNLQRDMGLEEKRAMGWLKPGTDEPIELFKTPDGGAATSVFAATSPYLTGKGGSFLRNCGIATPFREGAMDPEEARRLWEVTEDMVGETLDLP